MSLPLVKPEFPPLLAPGFHRFTVAELRRMCVRRFLTSISRSGIMDGLHDLLRQLSAAGITGEVWVDGSFVTEKIDPEDADLLIRVSSEQYDKEPTKRAAIDWAADASRADTHSCDVYKWIEFSRRHPLFADNMETEEYWTNWYGHSRGGEPKGIAVISLPVVIS
jgi:hypothetical protein